MRTFPGSGVSGLVRCKNSHSGVFQREKSPVIGTRGFTGILNVKTVPTPDWLSTQIRPPCSSINRLLMLNPKPVPPYRRRMDPSTCWKGWNKFTQIFCSDPSPCIRHRNQQIVIIHIDPQINPTKICKAPGITQKIQNHFPNACAVAKNGRKVFLQYRLSDINPLKYRAVALP